MDLFLPNIFESVFFGGDVQAVFATAEQDTFLFALGVVLLALLGAGFRKLVETIAGNAASNVVNVLTFPGVFIHESSHALVALLTGAKVTEFSLVPDEDNHSLGHVCYRVSKNIVLAGFQRTLIGIAPSVIGFLGLLFLLSWAIPHADTWWLQAILWYLVVCLLCHSKMSRQDVPSVLSIITVIIVLFILFLIVPVNPYAILDAMGLHVVAPS